MANPTEYKIQQKAMFFRRIQVILIGVIAVSVLEQSAKRDERLQADRANQRIAKTSQRKTTTQAITPQAKPIALKASKPSTKSETKSEIKSGIKSDKPAQ